MWHEERAGVGVLGAELGVGVSAVGPGCAEGLVLEVEGEDCVWEGRRGGREGAVELVERGCAGLVGGELVVLGYTRDGEGRTFNISWERSDLRWAWMM